MKSFSSKIILFGEYSVIKGGNALIMPFSKYSGYLETTGLETDESLWSLYTSLKDSRILKSQINLDRLKGDILEGLRFISTIPQGMGLGSSGALCSAVFDKYSYRDELDLSLLKEYFSIIESHFHGKSSGIDPLVSYTNQCLFIDKDQNIRNVNCPDLKKQGQFYLFNSHIQRHTAPLVHSFLKDYSDPSKQKMFDKYIDLSNKCISKFLDQDKTFERYLHEVSQIQLEYFKSMIPNNIVDIWNKGLESKDYILKLCGAGGGGFFICYSALNKPPLPNLIIIS